MAEVTGTLTEIDGGHLAGKNPELIFTLDQPATSTSGVYPTEPAVVKPNSNGSFTVDLANTDNMRDDAKYRLSIRWLDDANNYVRIDYPDWHIRVPTGGGPIGNLRGPGSNMSMVYVSMTAPKKPQPWMLWLQQDPDNSDPFFTGNTGRLYRWENI